MREGSTVTFYKYKKGSPYKPEKIPAVVVKVEKEKAQILLKGALKPIWVLRENLSQEVK